MNISKLGGKFYTEVYGLGVRCVYGCVGGVGEVGGGVCVWGGGGARSGGMYHMTNNKSKAPGVLRGSP